MEKTNSIEIEEENTDKLVVYQSALDDSAIHIERAENLANIFNYDKYMFNDINIETVIKACEIAGLINYNKSKVKRTSKKVPKWELNKIKN